VKTRSVRTAVGAVRLTAVATPSSTPGVAAIRAPHLSQVAKSTMTRAVAVPHSETSPQIGLTAIGTTPKPSFATHTTSASTPEADRLRSVYFEREGWVDTPVHDRHRGEEIFPEVPLNSGFYRVVQADIGPEGTVVNAGWPYAVTGFCLGP